MADNDDEEPLAGEGTARQDILLRLRRAFRRRQVMEGVELRDILRDLSQSQVTEGVEPDEPEHISVDQEIVEKLRLADFCGPAWDYYARELLRYGFSVMKPWLATGKIFTICQEKSFGLQRPERTDWIRADLEGLAHEVVTCGLNRFKRALQDNVWNREGGTTLATFFINTCVLEFPNLYRKRWLNSDARWSHCAIPDPDIVAHSSPLLDPGEVVAMRIAIQEALRHITDDVTRTAVILQSEGYSYREITEFLGITPSEVKAPLLRRHRARWWNKSWRETGRRK